MVDRLGQRRRGWRKPHEFPLGRRRRRPPRTDRRADRRAEVRPRHRVPPRAHVLSPARPGLGRLAGRHRPADPLAVTPSYPASCSTRRRRRVARCPAGDPGARSRRRHRPAGHLATSSPPGSSARHAVARRAVRELGQTPAKGDRLTDWLHRPLTADRSTRSRRALPARPRGLRLQADRPRTHRLGRRGVRRAAPRPMSRTAPEERLPVSRTPARQPAPGDRPGGGGLGASARRRRSTSPCAVLPDLAILGTPSQPANLTEPRSAAAPTSAPARGRIPPQELVDVVATAKHAEPPGAGRNGGSTPTVPLRPALMLISADQPRRPQRADRHRPAGDATTSSPYRRRRGRPPTTAGAPSWWGGIERLLAGSAGLTFDGHGGCVSSTSASRAGHDAAPATTRECHQCQLQALWSPA